LKYKKRSRASRLGPLAEFQGMLRDYSEREMPCLLGDGAAGILTSPIEMQPGASLKALEDKLDAISCAIAAYHAWRYGFEGLLVFGDAANGYIAVPKPVTSSPAPSSP
jgi:predicted RNase H-like nuclease